ncbi:hypothetical protein Patl1_20587 [Pistacia atlantica]|uniref:Uncharacterized protein n=1 Tax=Pistacia atlantica TaxID=434234 RepID=A0ACC1BKD4_9ROSI|nr:hypothetical protein Patl1_20587 [Pistacia atlantica]
MAVFSHSNHLSLPLWDSSTLRPLLIELTREHERSTQKVASLPSGKFTADLSVGLPDEVRAALGFHKLPLGKSPTTGLDEVIAPVGAGWFKFQDELVQYMTYEIGRECLVDDVFAQRLLLKGCEPLPRRRCHPKSPRNYVEPTPFPERLWAKAPDTTIICDPYSCKSYQCLIDRNNAPEVFACKDCFDLQGREKNRWLFDKGLDYGIDQATGSHMPCLTLFDIYRVLRPRGLFWVDHFFCCGSQLNETHVLMFDRIGFRKLRWNTDMKLDRRIDKNEWYFSALLEKPMT